MKTFKAAFPTSIPVLAGYISLGIAFGLLLNNAGYGVLWALFMSVFIFAGSAQFLCVTLFASGATLLQVGILVFILNFRHFFYGLSMISKYRDAGKLKPYLMFALSDETYAINSSVQVPEGIDPHKFYFTVSLLDQSYWVAGSVIGATIGKLITFDSTGVDFAMTALFAVLVVEQWKSNKDHRPALIGFGITILALLLFGPDNFLIPGLITISAILLAMRKSVETREKCVTISAELTGQGTEEQSAEEQSAEEQSAEEQSAEEQSAEEHNITEGGTEK